MKKLHLLLLATLAIAIPVSCLHDSDSDNKDNDDYSEKSIVVTMVSPDVIDGRGSDKYQYDGEGWRVIATENTKVYVQNQDCTGLNKANPSNVIIGMTMFFKFEQDDVNYVGSPNVVRAKIIEAFRPECLAPVEP